MSPAGAASIFSPSGWPGKGHEQLTRWNGRTMIIDTDKVQEGQEFCAQLAVVGGGPAGIVTALEAASRGIDVVVVETGGKDYDPGLQNLTEAASWDRELHAPLS